MNLHHPPPPQKRGSKTSYITTHVWGKETDGNSATVRTILFDYRKTFDLIDHRILVDKLCVLDLPSCVVNWIIDFLSNRLQRTKLADECFSEWAQSLLECHKEQSWDRGCFYC